MLEKILLIDNLTRTPVAGHRDKVRTAFTLTTNSCWHPGGERKQTTVVAFGSQAERTAGLTRGQFLFPGVRQQTRRWPS